MIPQADAALERPLPSPAVAPGRMLPTTLAMVLIVLGFGLAAFVWGPIIPANGGYGWDGAVYGIITRDFHEAVFVKRVDAYRVQRVLPCGVVHYGLRLLGMPLDDAHIQRGFQVYNLAILLAGVFLWGAASRRMRLSKPATWVGFIGIFGNFAVMRMTFYYPVLTDTTAFALGLAALYAFVAERRAFLWLVGLAGAFSWPLVAPMVLLLLFFPVSAARRATSDGRKPLLVTVLPAASVLVFTLIRYAKGKIADNTVEPWDDALPLSLALVFTYLLFATRGLFDRGTLRRLLTFRKETRWSAAVAAVALVLAIVLVKRFVFVPGPAPGYTPKMFLTTTALLSVAKPAIFLVAHVVYFGPIVALAMLYWPRVCERARSYGLGAVGVIFAMLLLSITSESRHLLNFLPLAVAFTVASLDSAFKPHHVWLFAALGLLTSKCWFPMGQPFVGFWPPGSQQYFLDNQHYFMSQGPWMSDGSYFLQAAATLLVFLVVGLGFPRRV